MQGIEQREISLIPLHPSALDMLHGLCWFLQNWRSLFAASLCASLYLLLLKNGGPAEGPSALQLCTQKQEQQGHVNYYGLCLIVSFTCQVECRQSLYLEVSLVRVFFFHL